MSKIKCFKMKLELPKMQQENCWYGRNAQLIHFIIHISYTFWGKFSNVCCCSCMILQIISIFWEVAFSPFTIINIYEFFSDFFFRIDFYEMYLGIAKCIASKLQPRLEYQTQTSRYMQIYIMKIGKTYCTCVSIQDIGVISSL